eukprot:scaffold106198_cov36-Phaeocystis_antarctica.AAC.1
MATTSATSAFFGLLRPSTRLSRGHTFASTTSLDTAESPKSHRGVPLVSPSHSGRTLTTLQERRIALLMRGASPATAPQRRLAARNR